MGQAGGGQVWQGGGGVRWHMGLAGGKKQEAFSSAGFGQAGGGASVSIRRVGKLLHFIFSSVGDSQAAAGMGAQRAAGGQAALLR